MLKTIRGADELGTSTFAGGAMFHGGDDAPQASEPSVALHLAQVLPLRLSRFSRLSKLPCPRFYRRHGRRLLALVLLLGVAVGRLEAMFPDVHDGDASETRSLVLGTVGTVGADQANATSLPQPNPPVHSTHMEHCGHSHLLVLGSAIPLATPLLLPSTVMVARATRPALISLPPQERPPIA